MKLLYTYNTMSNTWSLYRIKLCMQQPEGNKVSQVLRNFINLLFYVSYYSLCTQATAKKILLRLNSSESQPLVNTLGNFPFVSQKKNYPRTPDLTCLDSTFNQVFFLLSSLLKRQGHQ